MSDAAPPGRHSAALAETLDVLGLDASYGALVTLARSLAEQLDDAPSVAVIREYRNVLVALLAAGGSPLDESERRAALDLLRAVSTPSGGAS